MTNWPRYAISVLVLAILLPGCASRSLTPVDLAAKSGSKLTGRSTADQKMYLYATNSQSGNVSAYSIDGSSGSLTPIAGSPFAAGFGPDSIAADPSGRFAYVANCCSNVSAYAIDASSGVLTPLPGAPDSPALSVAIDPRGRFLYGAQDGAIFAYALSNSTGALTPVPGSPFPAEYAVAVAVDRTGKFAYAADKFSDGVLAYVIDPSSGALTPVTGSPFSAGTDPDGLATDPNGDFLYVVNFFSFNVSAYKINRFTGALTAVAGSPFDTGVEPAAVTIDPSGRFAYVADSYYGTSQNLSGYTIDASTGALKPLNSVDFPAHAQPDGVAVDPTGRYLYVSDEGSSNISAFAINSVSGELTQIAGSPFASGKGPAGLVVVRPCAIAATSRC